MGFDLGVECVVHIFVRIVQIVRIDHLMPIVFLVWVVFWDSSLGVWRYIFAYVFDLVTWDVFFWRSALLQAMCFVVLGASLRYRTLFLRVASFCFTWRILRFCNFVAWVKFVLGQVVFLGCCNLVQQLNMYVALVVCSHDLTFFSINFHLPYRPISLSVWSYIFCLSLCGLFFCNYYSAFFLLVCIVIFRMYFIFEAYLLDVGIFFACSIY